MAAAGIPSRTSLRRLLEKCLVSDSDVDAFVLDHFPALKKRFTAGMDCTAKLNLLLEYQSAEQILQGLLESHPQARALFQRLESERQEPTMQRGASTNRREPAADARPEPMSRPLAGVLWSTLATRRGLLRVILSALGAAALAAGLWAQPRWSLGVMALAILVVLASLASLLHTLWQRWRIPAVSSTRFIGPLPMDENDAKRFYGRKAKLDELTQKLAQREIRHILVFGVSGCGKTSLLRAGLIPRLREKQSYECVYLRFTDDPVGALQHALRSVAADDKSRPSAPAPTLVAELQQAQARAKLPILLCIDQFEEFQINPIGGTDFRQVLDLIWAISGTNANTPAKLVLCLRDDFLSLLTDFYQDKGFARGEEKVRIEPFEEDVAKEVIEGLLRGETGGLIWDPALVRRVLDDLVFEKLSYGERRKYVLPTELQIVFQMVQSRRIDRDENYPGKKKLLLDYISEAIATVPGADSPLVKQLLLSLIDAGGLTKAKPQTLAQLAQQMQEAPETVRRVLLHLDLHRHIVRTFHPEKPGRPSAGASTDGERARDELHYELAHDYLAGVIRIVAGAEMSGAKRSQALLEMARLRAQDDPGFRMPILDCFQLWRYPAEQSTPDDRALLRRSLWAFGLRYCLPVLGLFLVASFIRFGTYTIRVQYSRANSEVVLIRGIAALQPLLGPREPSAFTGLNIDSSDWHTQPTTQALVKELTDGIWRPSGLSFLSDDWDPDLYLRRRIATAIRPLAFPQGENCMYTKRPDLSFAFQLLAVSADINQDLSKYKMDFECGLKRYIEKCSDSEDESDACSTQFNILESIDRLLNKVAVKSSTESLHAYLSRPSTGTGIYPHLLENLGNLAVSSLPPVGETLPADESALLQTLQKRLVETLHQLNADLSPQAEPNLHGTADLARLIKTLEKVVHGAQPDRSALLDDTNVAASIRDVLIRALSQPMTTSIRRSIIASLMLLRGTDPITIQHLLSQFGSTDAIIQVMSFSALLEIDPKRPELRRFFAATLEDALRELKGYDRKSATPQSARSKHTLDLFAGVMSSLRRDHRAASALTQGPDGAFSQFAKAQFEDIIDHYEIVQLVMGQEADFTLGTTFTVSHNDYTVFSTLISLWRYVQPLPDISKILTSLTKQRKETDFPGYDLRPIIFNVNHVDRVPDPLSYLLESNQELRTKVESLIGESGAEGDVDCEWLAAALRYNISNPSIKEKRLGRQDFCSSELSEAIARYEILKNPSASDDKTLDEELARLQLWLTDPESAKLRRYQAILHAGYEFLARLLQNDPNKKGAWVAQQQRALLNSLRRGTQPLRQRLAEAYVLEHL